MNAITIVRYIGSCKVLSIFFQNLICRFKKLYSTIYRFLDPYLITTHLTNDCICHHMCLTFKTNKGKKLSHSRVVGFTIYVCHVIVSDLTSCSLLIGWLTILHKSEGLNTKSVNNKRSELLRYRWTLVI